jgi:hypothetical protein
MTTYAVYDEGVFTGVLREFDEKPILEGKPWRKFYQVLIEKPSFNPVTQVRTGPVISEDHTLEIRTLTWTVRAKTSEELDADKESTLYAYDLLNFEVNFDQENRIRVLEGKATITKLQYRNALKARL